MLGQGPKEKRKGRLFKGLIAGKGGTEMASVEPPMSATKGRQSQAT
jgi:hypothetical protein